MGQNDGHLRSFVKSTNRPVNGYIFHKNVGRSHHSKASLKCFIKYVKLDWFFVIEEKCQQSNFRLLRVYCLKPTVPLSTARIQWICRCLRMQYAYGRLKRINGLLKASKQVCINERL